MDRGRGINKPTLNDKPLEKLRFFCRTTKAVPCRYCGVMTRHSPSVGDCEISDNDIDKIIACPHICKMNNK